MKNRKLIVFLFLAVVVLGAAEFVLSRHDSLDRFGKESRVASRTAIVEDAGDFTTVVLERRGEATTQIDFVDGAWQMTRPFAADTDPNVVLRLLDALAKPVGDQISTITDAELLRLGRTRKDYSLDEPRLRVVLSNDVESVALSFGTIQQSGEGVYAAVDGERSVLVVPMSVLEAVDVPAEQFRQRRLFAFGADEVASFVIRQAPGAILAFERDGEGWRVGADKAEASRVAKFLDDVTSAEAKDFVCPTNVVRDASSDGLASRGLDPEKAVTVTFKRAGGRNASISFGGIEDGKNGEVVYALVHNGETIVTVPSALKDAAMQTRGWFADARLFQVAAEKVEAISLKDGEAGVSVSRAADGSWRLDAPISAPADAAAVGELLKRVRTLTAANVVADGVSVSLGGESKPVVVSRSSLFAGPGGFEGLRAKEIVDFSGEDVKRLLSNLGDAVGVSVVYSKDRRAWNVETAADGAAVSGDGVATVLAALSPLKATEIVKLKVAADELEKYGLEKPMLRLAVDLDRVNAVRRNIFVGAEAPGGGRYATVGSADAVFVISRESFDALSKPLVK